MRLTCGLEHPIFRMLCGLEHPLSGVTCGLEHYHSEAKVQSADSSTIFLELIYEPEHPIASGNLRIRASYYGV